jgi:uncharacterized protein (AIM24 family)
MTAVDPPPPPPTSTYACPYCRITSQISELSCPECGAPVDIAEAVSDSGWIELPSIRDMARIQFGHSHAQISGAYVPVVEMELDAADSVYFSHHVLLWCDTQVQLDNMPMAGAWNRTLAGMPLVMMVATGPGRIAFSDDHPGETIAVPLAPGQAVDVHEHRFLTATNNVKYDWFNSGVWYWSRNGNERTQHFPIGRFLDRFYAYDNGLLFLHAPGNVFIRELAQGQTILVHPSALLFKDPYVTMQLHFEYPAGYSPMNLGALFGTPSAPIIPWLRLWGPGRVAVQSVFTDDHHNQYRITSSSPATEWHWA